MTTLPLTPKLVRRQAIRVTAESMVRMRPLFGHGDLPLLVEPATPGVNGAAWIENHKRALAELLPRPGAILFRGFGIADRGAFQHRSAARRDGEECVSTCRTRWEPDP